MKNVVSVLVLFTQFKSAYSPFLQSKIKEKKSTFHRMNTNGFFLFDTVRDNRRLGTKQQQLSFSFSTLQLLSRVLGGS